MGNKPKTTKELYARAKKLVGKKGFVKGRKRATRRGEAAVEEYVSAVEAAVPVPEVGAPTRVFIEEHPIGTGRRERASGGSISRYNKGGTIIQHD